MVLWLVCSYLFYRRFPNNYLQPNFFGEEGNIFAKNIINNGFFNAIGSTFNGYYIWGIYILEKIAFTINWVFYGNEFVNLPRAFALVSYGFLGLIATLPLLLFRRYLKLPALILSTGLILYVPLVGWDYGILGTLGNVKFALIFVGFLMLIYRYYLPSSSRKIYLVDLVLLICAYTNVTIYAMLPFALLKYWPKIVRKKFWLSIKTLIRVDRSVQSLFILGIAILPQLYVIQHYGVALIPGYLDSPYNPNRTIEIFISRSYLYEFLFPINKYLSDTLVVVSFIAIIGLLWRFTKKYKEIVIFGMLTIFVATFLFVIKRPGISDFYIDYKDPGPAQFFFPQNWIFGFVGSILVVEIISKIRSICSRMAIYFLIVLVFLVYMAPLSGSFGKNDFESKTIGNIYSNAQLACSSAVQVLSITVYPSPNLHYNGLTRDQLCTPSVINYQPQEVDLGLTPFNNDYLQLTKGVHFSQTFRSTYNNLNGLGIYFSTFDKNVRTPYMLRLLDSSCKQQLRNISVRTSKILDNNFFTVRFPTINNSANTSYCFTMISNTASSDPLALQLSGAGIYLDGQATINGTPSTQDIVFKLHYK